MSLQAMWDGVQAGCVAVPQHGYFSTEPGDSYRLVWSVGGNRHSFALREFCVVTFDCPSPPASFRMIFNEKPPGGSSIDPILRMDAFLGVCGSRGFGLGTPRWFGMAAFNFTIHGRVPISPDWLHLQYYGTNEQSFGMVSYLGTPP